MINLIPTSAKQGVVREYWLRVVAVWMFLAGTACLLIASLMLPTYMLLARQLTDLQSRVDEQASLSTGYDSNASALTQAMNTANLLAASNSSDSSFLTLENTLHSLAGVGIKITHVSFARQGTTTSISLDGSAATRQNLADFRDVLESDPRFEGVVLPLASLLKERDILFAMTFKGIATTTP
jgi:hypothetical protein